MESAHENEFGAFELATETEPESSPAEPAEAKPEPVPEPAPREVAPPPVVADSPKPPVARVPASIQIPLPSWLTRQNANRFGPYFLWALSGVLWLNVWHPIIHLPRLRREALPPETKFIPRDDRPAVEAQRPEARREPQQTERREPSARPPASEPSPNEHLVLKAPELEKPHSLPEPEAAAAPKPAHVEVHKPSPTHKAHPGSPSTSPSAPQKTAQELQAMEREQQAKRMAEARKLYVEAFGEMKKNPADAKAKFEKVMELAGPTEPLWSAALKYTAKLEELPGAK